ncbi:MAG TPA: Rrf2 family transcriptional regulator [Planctomycetota bacterium]|nr:Rrf2 family transcriptional regulator [Planctomycetota bacterium]
MFVSQKCHYGLRALFELARRYGEGTVKNSEIAEAQSIPVRFLEVILSQLKRGGFVSSKRGSAGGYVLMSAPGELTVGSVVRFLQGPIGGPAPADEEAAPTDDTPGSLAFRSLWDNVQNAVSSVLDTTTFKELLEEDMRLREKQFVPSYTI